MHKRGHTIKPVSSVFVLVLSVVFLTGCKDAREEAYAEGYAAGHEEASESVRRKMEEECAEKVNEARSDAETYSHTATTEVCGGGGVNVGNKHISPGKTGCVRVYADGRAERY